MQQETIEYSIVGGEIEEHFETYSEAEDYLRELPEEQQKAVQFFSKEWTDGIEGDVEIFKNFGEVAQSREEHIRECYEIAVSEQNCNVSFEEFKESNGYND